MPISLSDLRYQTHPTVAEAWDYYNFLRDDLSATTVLSLDLETPESRDMDEDATDGFQSTEIRQFQCSHALRQGIAFPWEGEYRRIACHIMHLPNPKCGHNWWLFDQKVLAAEARRTNLDTAQVGPFHDTLQMFHWWQPDLPAHLQAAASFVNFPFPWKHLHGANEPWYGCADVDAGRQLFVMLKATMERDGIWESYLSQVYDVRPVLAEMERRGVPIDDERRLALGAEFDAAQKELGDELQGRYPEECRRIHPKDGYKKVPKDTEGLVLRPFDVAQLGPDGALQTATVERWCRLEPFLPNSWQQLIAYMKAKGHKVPKTGKGDEASETTAKKELVRLAKAEGDDFYLKVIEYRELGKARGTYVEGFRPNGDSRVHTTFTFDTGTGQLSSRNPNVQNFPKHGRLAGALRAMVAAPRGHILTEWDYKAFHVMTTGFEAGSAAWMRLARLDMHSFVAGVFLKLWKPEFMEEPDDALMDRFAWFKTDPARKVVRDRQAKAADLGIGFGMGKRRLYQENLEHFPDEKTAGKFIDILHDSFADVICVCKGAKREGGCQAWQHEVRLRAHDKQELRTLWGALRRFYEVFVWDSRGGGYKKGDQAEEAVAFMPANDAFGEMRTRYKELEASGLADKYGLMNTVHDSVQFCFPAAMLDDHAAEVGALLASPSRTLVSQEVPQGLQVGVELSAGPNWAEMAEVKLASPSCALPPLTSVAPLEPAQRIPSPC